MKNIKTSFYNFDFKNQIMLPKNNKKFILSVNKTLNNLPALNIVKDKNLLEETIKEVKKFSKNKKSFIVFGTGGSNLGARALINILQNNYKINISFLDNIDPINFKNTINKFNLKTTGFIVISKSGTTPETLSQFASLIQIFNQNNALKTLYRNSLIVTENKNSPLYKIAFSNNCKILEHKKDIGGRYSIFSNVGMVPAIIAGLNVKKIHEGALYEINKFSKGNFLTIPQFFRYQKINKLITNSVLMTYSDALFYYGKWYLQLWSESLGKNNKGITPIHAVGTTDQHSQLQLYLDGPKDKFFTFITTNHSNKGFKLHSQTMNDNNLSYLNNKKMGDLMQAEQKATIDTFKKKNFLIREIHIPDINEYTIGRLIVMGISETIATCLYYDVNPFDQPAVEEGKILTKQYLNI